MKKLITNGPVPLYYQLREIIRDKILAEEWTYGDEIPSEFKLCEEFNLCRATVKQALDGLVNEGLVVRRQGKGSFVAYQKRSGNFLLEPTFTNEANRSTAKDYSSLRFADWIDAENPIASYLNKNIGDRIYQIDRIHFVEGEPVTIDRNFLASDWVRDNLLENPTDIAIYKYIENTFEVHISDYKMRVESIVLDLYEQEIFKSYSPATGLVVECTSYVNKEPIMFNRRIYRGDRSILQFEFSEFSEKIEATNAEIALDKRFKRPQ